MTVLPKSWAETELANVAIWGSGGTPSRSNPEYYGGSIPWIKTGELGQRLILDTEEKISDLGLKNSSAKLFPKGSIAVAMYGATIGKTSILGIDASTNQACAVGIPFNGITTSEYLYHYLSSQKDAFIEAGKGGAQPNISQSVIKTWPIPLAPLAEQKRIVDKLDTVLARVDACRERLDRVPLILKRFRQSVLAAAMSGALTSDYREQKPLVNMREELDKLKPLQKARRGVADVTGPNNDYLDNWKCPDSWWQGTAAALLIKGVFIDLKDGNHGSNHPKVSDFSDRGLPFITAAQVENFKIDYDGAYKIDGLPLAQLRVGFAKLGDVVLTHKGSVGRVAIVDRDCVLTPQTTYYRLNDEFVNAKFHMYFMASAAFSGQLDQIKSQTTRDFVPITQQYGLLHLIPSMEEQSEIVRRVDILFAFADRLDARIAVASTATERLTPALLTKAFRGELVSQDPNDEPAVELLKRLTAAQQAPYRSTGKRKSTEAKTA